MNISVYLFGKFKSGYSQYPSDYSKSIFAKFYEHSKSKTQITVHRERDLMYYGYIRKLEDDNYIGLCTVVNGKFVFSIEQLFSVYERVIELMVKNGYLIHFDDHGEITTSVVRLYENAEEISLITGSLQNAFDGLENNSQALPPLNNGVAKDTFKSFSIQEDAKTIVDSTFTNAYTFVYKSKGFNTATLNSYIEIIGRKEKQEKQLRAELNNKIVELNKSRAAQKRIKAVAILSLILVGLSFFGIHLLNKNSELTDHLSSTQEELDITNTDLKNSRETLASTFDDLQKHKRALIDERRRVNTLVEDSVNMVSTISVLSQEITDLKGKVERLQYSLQGKESLISQMKSEIDKLKTQSISTSSVSVDDFTLKLLDDNEIINSNGPWSVCMKKKDKRKTIYFYVYQKGSVLISRSLDIVIQ